MKYATRLPHSLLRDFVGIMGLAAGTMVWLHLRTPRPAGPRLEHTPVHRGGSGSALLLVHGVTASWRVWSPVLPHLECHHDVLAPTLLGHPGARPFDSSTKPSLAALVDGVEAELDRAGLDRVHVVGNSLGGWVAIELARRGRARSLVLISPGGTTRSQWRLELTSSIIRLSIQRMARLTAFADVIASRPLLRWPMLYTQVAHPSRVSPEAVAVSIRGAASMPGVVELLKVLPHEEQVAPLPADRDYPIRLIWPQRDRVLPYQHFGASMVERLPGAELVRIDDAGHVPMSDDPAGVARLILEVTRAVDATTSPNETVG
ncbi:alpha/beta fold hydrolase [Mycobacterium sp.]|uniref:alpha/beta fold hydrolase n=1 Tax=Mycobacterium sp. TaxID=1785 RepID=UPI003D0B34D3